jgi:GGDEF domain-containing protein
LPRNKAAQGARKLAIDIRRPPRRCGAERRPPHCVVSSAARRDRLALDALIARADAALYRAKRDNRGGVMFSDEAEPPSSLTGP